jgi:excinuclease UvrABC helicase subunit UvrB
MSKKSRKKVVRTVPAKPVAGNNASVPDRPLVKAATKKMPAAVTHYLSSEELDKRYQYVKDDLKLIAIIAIPMILVLIIAGIFIII